MDSSTALPTSGDLFAIDELLCYQFAQHYSEYKLSSENVILDGVSPENQIAFKIAFVAICHQFNWDFLQNTLARNLKILGTLERLVDQLCEIKATDFESWFTAYPRQERVRAKERAEFLRTTGREMRNLLTIDPQKFLSFQQINLGGPNGLLELLDQFTAYGKDPLRKKTNVLLHDLVRERIVRFPDEELIEPAVDYHIMRLYLRTGRVYPLHASTFLTLASSNPLPRGRLITLLRRAVSDALSYTARLARLPVPDLNYIEWQIGRSVCISGDPFCQSGNMTREIDSAIAPFFASNCGLSSICRAFKDPAWMKLQEPVYAKSFY